MKNKNYHSYIFHVLTYILITMNHKFVFACNYLMLNEKFMILFLFVVNEMERV